MTNVKKKKTELEIKIYNDIQSKIREYYNRVGIEYKEKEKVEDTIIDFFSYLYKLIPKISRNVHYSKELLQKITSKKISNTQIEILRMYGSSFVKGENMNVFLSNNIKKVRKVDFLLYTWHIYHLHMSEKFVKSMDQMKNNRSDTQLLCIITKRDVYFLDVVTHPARSEEYFSIYSLQIIIDNGWMEQIGLREINDTDIISLQYKITESKDIFQLYSQATINILFEFNGKIYIPLEPMSCTRRPFPVVNEMIKINRAIHNLNCEKGVYKSFQLDCNQKGELLGLVEFELDSKEKRIINIF